jgi:hypothetical protein
MRAFFLSAVVGMTKQGDDDDFLSGWPDAFLKKSPKM